MTYDNTNSGAIFKNDKQGNEKRPDYTGKLNVEGKDFYVSAWVKDGKEGSKFLSLSLKAIEAKQETKTPEYQESKDDQSNTGLPF